MSERLRVYGTEGECRHPSGGADAPVYAEWFPDVVCRLDTTGRRARVRTYLQARTETWAEQLYVDYRTDGDPFEVGRAVRETLVEDQGWDLLIDRAGPSDPETVFDVLGDGRTVPSSLDLDDADGVKAELQAGTSVTLRAGSFAEAADAVRAFAPLGIDAMITRTSRVDADPDLLVAYSERCRGLSRVDGAGRGLAGRARSGTGKRADGAPAVGREESAEPPVSTDESAAGLLGERRRLIALGVALVVLVLAVVGVAVLTPALPP